MGQGLCFQILTKLFVVCDFDLVVVLLVTFPLGEFRIQFLTLKSPNWKGNWTHILWSKVSLGNSHKNQAVRVELLLCEYICI